MPKKKFIAILHDIRSVHNVGSIFRTADGAGFSHIYLTGITPEPKDRFGNIRSDFRKVSLGAEENILWEHKKSIIPLLKKLKKENWFVIALEQGKGSIGMEKTRKLIKNKNKIALIAGNEVDGIPEKVFPYVDAIMELPMRGKKESLNVSVAFGIAAYGTFSQN